MRCVTSIVLSLAMVFSVSCRTAMAAGGARQKDSEASSNLTQEVDKLSMSAKDVIKSLQSLERILSDMKGGISNFEGLGDFWKTSKKESESQLWRLCLGWTDGYGENLQKAFSLFNWQQMLCNIISVLFVAALLFKS